MPAASRPAHRVLSTLAATLTVGLLFTACSRADAPEAAPAPAQPTPTAPAAAPPVTPSAGATVGGDGSDIQLDPLSEADVRDAALPGELACSFATDKTAPLLLASGNVGGDDPAQGIVKVSGYVERIGAPGGFNAITDGATFNGKGKTIEIALTGEATGGGESPPRPATLTYQRADGASRAIEGMWQCGP
ncbi:hypothetical protein IMZ29_18870 [Achromobacter sp. GG226]|uniref:hypothetical protein n=1 Tax=Verticiella alkaliphila TaxID=2779529 RepID=UPI001C0BE579|nr:hypothetical protein [Verticiella sp. GG226]MBU4612532.1 hypothetical protein [Verticiella sp. GG226]